MARSSTTASELNSEYIFIEVEFVRLLLVSVASAAAYIGPAPPLFIYPNELFESRLHASLLCEATPVSIAVPANQPFRYLFPTKNLVQEDAIEPTNQFRLDPVAQALLDDLIGNTDEAFN